MKQELITMTGLGIAGAIAGLIIAMFLQAQPTQGSTWGFGPTIGAATTSSQIAVTSSTRVLATTTNPAGVPGTTSFSRVYATICNPNAVPVALLLDNDKKADATARVTTYIAAAAGYDVCYEINDRNTYMGSVQASSTNGSVSINVADYVQ